MDKLLNFLKGKRTLIMVALGVAVNFAVYMGWLSVDQIAQVNAILAFLGLGFLRVSIK